MKLLEHASTFKLWKMKMRTLLKAVLTRPLWGVWGLLQANCGAFASVRHCGGFSKADLSNIVAVTWLLSSWWVHQPTEGSLCSGRYSHSSSGELSGSPSFRMSPDSVISECSCSSPSMGRHSASDPKCHFGPKASLTIQIWWPSAPTYSVPHICSPPVCPHIPM